MGHHGPVMGCYGALRAGYGALRAGYGLLWGTRGWLRAAMGQLWGGGAAPVVVLAQGAVEPCQLPQLHLAEVVLVLGGLDALLQDVPDLRPTASRCAPQTPTHTLPTAEPPQPSHGPIAPLKAAQGPHGPLAAPLYVPPRAPRTIQPPQCPPDPPPV